MLGKDAMGGGCGICKLSEGSGLSGLYDDHIWHGLPKAPKVSVVGRGFSSPLTGPWANKFMSVSESSATGISLGTIAALAAILYVVRK